MEVTEVMMVGGHHGGGEEVRAEEAAEVEAVQMEEMVMVEVPKQKCDGGGTMRYKRL